MNNIWQEAVNAFNRKDFKAALEQLKKIPSEPVELYLASLQMKAQIYFQEKKTPLFIQALKDIFKTNPNDKSNLLALSIHLANTGQEHESYFYLDTLCKNIKSSNDSNFYSKNIQQLSSLTLLSVNILKSRIIESFGNKTLPKNFKTFLDNLFNSVATKSAIKSEYQKPTYLHYPGIESSAWHNEDFLPELGEQDFQKIQIEVSQLLEKQKTRPYYQSEVPSEHLLETLRNNEDWSSIILHDATGVQFDENLYPTLSEYIKKLPLAFCPPHAPEVMLSILKPKTHIPPHYGLSNFKLTLHLPILVPEGELSITVGKQSRIWTEGQHLLFDDSYLHEAENMSDKTRMVLIADIWHPDLSRLEQECLTVAIKQIDHWHKEAFNTLFNYSLQI